MFWNSSLISQMNNNVPETSYFLMDNDVPETSRLLMDNNVTESSSLVRDTNVTEPSRLLMGKNVTDTSHLLRDNNVSETPSLMTESHNDLLAKAIWIYVSPLILVSGVLGNSLAFVVLLRKSLRKSSTFCLLSALAVSDCMVLLTGLLRDWISIITPDISQDFDWFNSFPRLCKPVEIISITAMYCSAWLIVAVSVDRYLAVCRPAQAQTMRTPAHAFIIIIFTAILALMAALIFTFVDPDKKCFSYDLHPPYLVVIDVCLYSLLPSFMLFYLNGFILHKVVKRHQRQQRFRQIQLHQTETVIVDSSNHQEDTSIQSERTCTNYQEQSRQAILKRKQRVHLTCVTLTVSLTYLAMTLPNTILLIILKHHPYMMKSAYLVLVQTFTMLLWYFNHAVNFYLYCLTAQQVRKELALLGKCRNV